MGIDVVLYLFDLNKYNESVLPAIKTYLEKDDPKPLITLIEEILNSPYIKEYKEKYQGDLENRKGIYYEYIDILSGRQHYSIEEETEERARTGKMTQASKEYFLENLLAGEVVSPICIPDYGSPSSEQDMSGRDWIYHEFDTKFTTPIKSESLITYLYDHSPWIEDLFTRGGEIPEPLSGGRVEYGMSGAQFFNKLGLERFLQEVNKVPRPSKNPTMAKQYDNLVQLIKRALDNPDLTLLLAVL